ncbi:hypothetical protein Tco_1016559 [Tanacetum coccineum]|uniref:Reverse transcriptase domain-containing protein n=1 Tax=Tanacetum coccineum TaxID=301880 RepID=A0ABQ5FPL2_9ASTR
MEPTIHYSSPSRRKWNVKLSFADALLHMPKFVSTFKSLLSNKEKLFELASTLFKWRKLLGGVLNKLRRKTWSTRQIFIPCDFPGVDECLLFELTDEAFTFKVGHTSRYSRNYYDETVHQVNVIDVACEEYAQEVLGFSDSSTSGNPTPSDPIIASSSPSFTPFERGDFILEEIKACLSSDSIPPGIDDADFDPEGDIRLLEKYLTIDPIISSPSKELNFEEIKMIKSSIDDPPELELKDFRLS